MKVEIGESLGYSFLRHVEGCWLVQTNWKASDDWPKHLEDGDLEQEFSDMRRKFDPDGSVFGKTTGYHQLLKQSEIDVVGIGFSGDIYAVEVAFHENGLQYGSSQETQKRVLKKMLRAKFLLDAYQLADGKQHIYFVSPKVHNAVKPGLEEIFDRLNREYADVDWQLLTDRDFVSKLLEPTLKAAKDVADTSELFMRSAKLLELGGLIELGAGASSPRQESTLSASDTLGNESGQIQPLVRNLMQTVLEDFPALLAESDHSNLMDKDYCRRHLGLEIGGFALLRRQGEGAGNNGRPRRYWQKVYAGRYFVTNNWWGAKHRHNAESLLRWVGELIRRNAGQPGIADLENRRDDFQNYLDHPE